MELFGIDLYDSKDLIKLLFKFSIDLLFLFIIVRVIYYRIKDEKDYVFTFFMFNILTFFICYLLRKVPMEMGFALGLFAVFGILRYRTEAIPIRQMTYLFIVIGLSMINSLANKSISWFEILLANGIITIITYLIDRVWFSTIELTKTILYEKIELIKPENEQELIEDLKQRTGLQIVAVKIDKVDFLRDTAQIKIYYH
ncbi:MAG: DUF4956 domain-containing protein [Bacteroidota bacterium]|nr:DUF4956 domain-containing protein [Bacteroidota bacterium]MED5301927.1 DUF4956 domain-containing protein [Bacteroidota bacterium]|tara:strand:+ start:633 stop:1229 length:597 start_codon:yes stop_codon:yes gene_type:complete